MQTRFSFLCALAVLVATGPGFAQSQVLVQGQPPLTEETVGRFTEFFEWAFDVQLTVEQRQVLRKYTVDSWTQKKTSDMNDVVQLVEQQTELSKLDAQQRGLVRLKLEPELLAQMRNQPNEPMAKWALAVYEASHRAIAPGAPPLTRQSTDAFLDALFFMVGEVSGQQSLPDQKLKDDWAKALAANYPKMTAELKQQIAGMPMQAALLRVAWPALSTEQKTQYRAQWAEQLKTLLPAQAPAAQASKGAAGGGKQSVAEMMAEQNRRHQSYMNMSNAMMDIYKIKFNTLANWGGSPYRYW
ncbi:MAG: hypothetical protein ABSE56_14830 [Bryobacteraceae bacterium]|jgi:hypothetical protein